jgi:hypothetical protein
MPPTASPSSPSPSPTGTAGPRLNHLQRYRERPRLWLDGHRTHVAPVQARRSTPTHRDLRAVHLRRRERRDDPEQSTAVLRTDPGDLAARLDAHRELNHRVRRGIRDRIDLGHVLGLSLPVAHGVVERAGPGRARDRTSSDAATTRLFPELFITAPLPDHSKALQRDRNRGNDFRTALAGPKGEAHDEPSKPLGGAINARNRPLHGRLPETQPPLTNRTDAIFACSIRTHPRELSAD